MNDERIKKILKEANVCIILTGAGMGVDSGLSVFRDNDGLWNKFPKAKELNLSFEGLANPTHYLKYPEIVIPFYLERLRSYQTAEPHDGFHSLIEFAKDRTDGYFVATSNVDGLFQKSYIDENNLYEIHGSISNWQCSFLECTKKHGLVEMNIEELNLNDEIVLTDELSKKLKCKHCNSFLRPNILMFYDCDWYVKNHLEQKYMYERFFGSIFSSKVAIIEVGAGTNIRSIREMSLDASDRFNTDIIRINKSKPSSEDLGDHIIYINKSAKDGIEYILSLIK